MLVLVSDNFILPSSSAFMTDFMIFYIILGPSRDGTGGKQVSNLPPLSGLPPISLSAPSLPVWSKLDEHQVSCKRGNAVRRNS